MASQPIFEGYQSGESAGRKIFGRQMATDVQTSSSVFKLHFPSYMKVYVRISSYSS